MPASNPSPRSIVVHIIKTAFTCLLFVLLFLPSPKPALAALANTSQSPGTLSQGLVGHWTFDGGKMISNAADSSGLGNHGYLTNFGATSSAVTIGKLGQSLVFDGATNYVKIGSYDIGAGTVTSCAWIYPTSTTGNLSIFGDNAYVMFVASNTLKVTSNSFTTLATSPANTILINRWQHVCAVRLSSATATLYINGAVSGTPDQTNTIVTSAFTTAIGTRGSAAAFYFNGKIDDVRLYSRALSAEEIKQLYNLGSAKVNTSQNPAGSLTQGLIGWWTFDGKNLINNVADSSGAGNTGYFRMGTTGNTATSSAVVAGKIGQGLNFDGLSDQIITGSDFIGTSPITITAWIRPTSLRAGAPRIVDNTKTRFYVSSASRVSFSSDGATGVISGNNVPLNGKWQFVAVTRTAAGVANFYANGVPSGTANLNSGTPTAGSNVAIGGISGGPTSNPFEGSMDDVRVYNRVLSASEITQLYNLGSAKVNTSQNPAGTLSSGLVGWWTFDGKNLISNVADSSGAGNHGSMSGFGATSSAVVAGKIGQGLKFDGADDVINVGSGSNLDNLGPVTYSVWMNPSSLGEGSIGTIFDKGFFVSTRFATLNRIDFIATFTGTDLRKISAVNSFSLNRWSHVAISWDGGIDNAGVHIYVDGIETGYFTNTSATGDKDNDASAFMYLGNVSNLGRTFDGKLDDMRIYNRVLSAQEIKQIYSMGR